MVNENEANKNVSGGPGIKAGGDVSFGDITGQFAIGENVTQSQTTGQLYLEELKTNLLEFQKGIARLGLSDEDESIVSGNISAAIKEAKKEKPVLSRIKENITSAFKTIKDAGKTVDDLSGVYESAKKIARLAGIGLSLLL